MRYEYLYFSVASKLQTRQFVVVPDLMAMQSIAEFVARESLEHLPQQSLPCQLSLTAAAIPLHLQVNLQVHLQVRWVEYFQATPP